MPSRLCIGAFHRHSNLQIPDLNSAMVDFSLHNDGKGFTVVANWGKDWRSFQIGITRGSRKEAVRAAATTPIPFDCQDTHLA
jgi:hypothetical protein